MSDWNRRSLARRLEVLKLPVVPLPEPVHLRPTDLMVWAGDPAAVGVGPAGTAHAVWNRRDDPRRKQVTAHAANGDLTDVVEIETDVAAWFVQPLPEGQVLVAAARAFPRTAPNAEVWTADGRLVHAGPLGDAIEELLTTPTGAIWAGYFDEAMGGDGPQTHGLVRFRPDLSVDWLYPREAGLPEVFDSYSLNVAGERAYCCPYTDFHLLTASSADVRDLGAAPRGGASALLMRGADGALVGGFGPEYDLATPIRLRRDGIEAGAGRRIVRPDGLEVRDVRFVGRGADLHGFWRETWYRLGLDDLTA